MDSLAFSFESCEDCLLWCFHCFHQGRGKDKFAFDFPYSIGSTRKKGMKLENILCYGGEPASLTGQNIRI